MPRLTQTDLQDFFTRLYEEGLGTLEKGPSLQAGAHRLWLTLLDDATPSQLRLRKLVLSIPGKLNHEWFTTHPDEDRWQDLDTDTEHTSDEVLAAVRGAILRVIQNQ